jgi:hypothetical protein
LDDIDGEIEEDFDGCIEEDIAELLEGHSIAEDELVALAERDLNERKLYLSFERRISKVKETVEVLDHEWSEHISRKQNAERKKRVFEKCEKRADEDRRHGKQATSHPVIQQSPDGLLPPAKLHRLT